MNGLWALSFLTLAIAAHAEPASSKELTYGCKDLVVIGTVQSLNYTPVATDDILGHGWVTANIGVRKFIKGSDPRSMLPVRYFTHAYMRANRDFILVLRPDGAGGYIVESGWLTDAPNRPRLAPRCG